MAVINADCLEGMSWFEPDSIDAIVTDPPYELNFMGRNWDNSGIVYKPDVWRECLRVLKPGGHMLVFGAPRTFHRVAVAIEDAGFEIRDCIMWVFGSGFPKSHNMAPAIDKHLGAMGHRGKAFNTAGLDAGFTRPGGDMDAHRAVTPEGQQWQGWGSALKPAFEPVLLARKPLAGTLAQNVLQYGTGAINIDGCRVGSEVLSERIRGVPLIGTFLGADGNVTPERTGRWPANLIHDGSEEVVDLFPDVKGQVGMKKTDGGFRFIEAGDLTTTQQFQTGTTDSGSAARFFYCSKANSKDRDEGLDDFPTQRAGIMRGSEDGSLKTGAGEERTTSRKNIHPTVKPTDLMRYLCRLITPLRGTVLDPFAGSGSTGKAAVLEGFEFVGFELSEEYTDLANARIEAARRTKEVL